MTYHVSANEYLLPEPSEDKKRKGEVGPRQSKWFRKLAVGRIGGQRHTTVDSVLCRSYVGMTDQETGERFTVPVMTASPWELMGKAYADVSARSDGVSQEG